MEKIDVKKMFFIFQKEQNMRLGNALSIFKGIPFALYVHIDANMFS